MCRKWLQFCLADIKNWDKQTHLQENLYIHWTQAHFEPKTWLSKSQSLLGGIEWKIQHVLQFRTFSFWIGFLSMDTGSKFLAIKSQSGNFVNFQSFEKFCTYIVAKQENSLKLTNKGGFFVRESYFSKCPL